MVISPVLSEGKLPPPLMAAVPSLSQSYGMHPFAASLPLLLPRRNTPSPSLFHKQPTLFLSKQEQGLCCHLKGEPAKDGVTEGILNWVATSVQEPGSSRGSRRSSALGCTRESGTHARGPRVSYALQMAAFLPCRGAGG